MSEDLIKRSNAIKALNREKSDWNCDYNVPIDNCIKRLNKVKSADRPSAVDLSSVYSTAYKSGYEKGKADRPTWIPCSERLPSEKDYIGDVVIWCTDKSIVGVGWYYESTKSWATIDDTFPPILGEVIAWMPLPKPWEGADDE